MQTKCNDWRGYFSVYLRATSLSTYRRSQNIATLPLKTNSLVINSLQQHRVLEKVFLVVFDRVNALTAAAWRGTEYM